jgi:Flp pilus assembly protein TadD
VRAPAVWGGATLLLLVLSGYCYERNRMWGEPEELVAQAAEKATHNPRPLLNAAEILIRRNRCDLAAGYLVRAQRILPGSYFVMTAWGRTLACLGRTNEAVAMLTEAARIRPCSQVYEWLGLVYGQMGMLAEAGGAIQRAVAMDPASAEAHSALAFWYESRNDWQAAESEYRKSLELNPQLDTARSALVRLKRFKAELKLRDVPRDGSD